MTPPTNSPVFSPERADRAQAFFERALRHTKGKWARKPFHLTGWQRDDILRPLFGTIRFDEQADEWVRQYRIAWLELARGNGKSELLAGIGLLLLVADDEEGAEIYGAAKDSDQAGHVYRVAKRMVELSPALSKRLEIIDSRKMIVDPKLDSFYRVIAADAAGNLGQNPHGILFDEVIAQPSRELWDALRTGMGKRTQPLMIAATTAGNNPTSFAASEHAYCEQIANDPKIDPSRFVYMRNTPVDADWSDETNWGFANPALGDFLHLQALRDEAREAAINPGAENAFRQFRLNQWVTTASRWLSSAAWDANGGLVDETQLAGRICFGGLDLASTTDFTALVLAFPVAPVGYEIVCRFWLPQAAVDKRKDIRPTLDRWRRERFLIVTDGDVVDFASIRDEIGRLATTFDIHAIGYDPWGATQLVQELLDGGLAMIEWPQTTARLNAPAKELERLVGDSRLNHGGNPILRWMIGNTVVRIDSDGRIKPDRRKSTEKIDGVVALTMALGAATKPVEEQAIPAIY